MSDQPLIAAIERLREAILFLAEKMSARSGETTPAPWESFNLETEERKITKRKKEGSGNQNNAAGQAKNDPSNETALMAIFQKFYVEYPKHVGRGAAIRALRGALKVATAAQIIEGAKKFAAECKKNGTDFKYIPNPATWLNQQRWLDCPGIVESEQDIRARINRLEAGFDRALGRMDHKAAAVLSKAISNDIKKLEDLTQNRCEILMGL